MPARSMVEANIGRHYRLSFGVTAMAGHYSGCGNECMIDQCTHSNYGLEYGQPSGYGHEAPVMQENFDCGYDGCTLPGDTWGLQPSAMSDEAFTGFRRSVQRMSFESDKFDVIRQQLRRTYMTASQVRTLMSVFSFDSSRLELAQLAYPRVIDEDRF